MDMIPFTDEELMAPVRSVINKVRPSLALDGGDIDFLTVFALAEFKIS